MSVEHIVVNDTKDFDEALSKGINLSSDSKRDLYLLFTGAVVPSTGRSWCPDCVNADPIFKKVFSTISNGYILIEAPVIREEYKNPNYYYRNHKLFNLKCVPTLIKFKNGKVFASLNDNQSQSEELVDELIQS